MYTSLDSFLNKHWRNRQTNEKPTHTVAGDKRLGINNAAYTIPEKDMDTFNKLY